MNPVCIGLGTNMGDREANLHTALELLQPIVNRGAVSDIFETEPVGVVEQDWFLNMVLQGTTALTPLNSWRSCSGSKTLWGESA